MPFPYLEKILTARVYDVARETPLDSMPTLSGRLDNRVLLKREDLQPVFSFKLRGAYNRMFHLTEEERSRGVIAASAGNHAQGVALGARQLGIRAIIVMPQTTPSIKVDAVRSLGGKAVLHGDSYDDAYAHAMGLVEKHGYTFIHPFDDPYVIAGQGTVAMELLRQHPDPIDAVFICTGGGGLLAGMATYIKALRPEIRVIGVEPDDAPSMTEALRRKRRIILDQVGIFADGVAVRQVGEENYRLARKHVDEMLLVSTDEICAAIKDIFDDTRVMAEPAGALAVAGIKKYVEARGVSGQNLVAVLSGANMNFDRLRYVAERAELGERREALFAATIPERPGSFRAFCRAIGKRGITEFNYRYADDREAHVFVGVKLSGGDEERQAILESLRRQGYAMLDLTDNEMAKSHLRHMVGGHVGDVGDERVYRFEFPERPGALLRFLTRMGQDWNISLFHYRNHGAAYGRVLVGMQVPSGDAKRFQAFVDELGYPCWEETDNPVYRMFLGAL
ncbi:threonine ammonia-lyase, biosynthetic [Thioalkalivibrio sulfidiphilus]|uniref:L-threonine dehydratase n=1 Tax=Thioalkalivibrio sulfidiphilus (strain HL-EbGR7) TaxID=396588 RepID=B8GNF7_THISH|nr:threonine ammonia-lyase, biosynthetic [Thioalkalivibrio sulfidiphilus]ACL73848.1 threonine dehydratase [Thioalkalivibrio sulfidiphilus HL-EbGr7]